MQTGSWQLGVFRVAEALPDLGGELTESLELDGSMAITRPRALIRHCEDSRLTAQLELHAEAGSNAVIRFAHGRLEAVEVDGRPDFASLSKIEKWDAGNYKLSLRPLFSSSAPVPPPVLAPPKAFHEQSFDVTGGIPLQDLHLYDVDGRMRTPTPIELTPPPLPEVTPPPGWYRSPGSPHIAPMPSPIAPPHARGPQPSYSPLVDDDAPPEATAVTRDARLPPPTPEPRRMSLGAKIGITVGAVVVLGVGAGLAYQYAYVDRDESTASITPVKPVEKPAEPANTAAATPDKPATTVDKPPEKAPDKPSEPATPDKPEKPAAVAAKPEEPEEPATPTKPTKAAPDKPSGDEAGDQTRSPAVEKKLAKGWKLLLGGHSHGASDEFKAAEKLAPHDAEIAEWHKMAQGKTGKGELVIEGHGTVLVAGQAIKGPKKLKLPAGTYPIERRGKSSHVTLKKNGKTKLSAD